MGQNSPPTTKASSPTTTTPPPPPVTLPQTSSSPSSPSSSNISQQINTKISELPVQEKYIRSHVRLPSSPLVLPAHSEQDNSCFSSNWNNGDIVKNSHSNTGSNLDLRSEIYDNLLNSPTSSISYGHAPQSTAPTAQQPYRVPGPQTYFQPHPPPQHQQSHPPQVTPLQAKHTRSRSAIDPIITNELLRSSTPNGHSKHHQTSSTGTSASGSLQLPISDKSNTFLSGIEDKVSRFYYQHGLFCSRNPLIVILFAFLIVGISSFPIFNFFTISGVTSEVYVSSKQTFSNNFFNNRHGYSDDSHWFLKYFNLVGRNSNLQPKADKSLLFNHYPYNYHTHQPRWVSFIYIFHRFLIDSYMYISSIYSFNQTYPMPLYNKCSFDQR